MELLQVPRLSPDVTLSSGDDPRPVFRIRRHIGTGGAGRVYQALHLRSGERVVIKIPLKWESVRDIFTEVRWILGKGGLVNIAQIRGVDMSRINGGDLEVPYIVSDFYRASVGAVLDEQVRVDPDTAIKWLRQIAMALQSSNVVHRDLKPDNILLDEKNDAYLADFGIAIPANPYRRRKQGIVVRGLNGTIKYMAPEQIGEDESIDMRADIYALGLIAFELVTGESARPSKPASMSQDDYLDMILYEHQIPYQRVTTPRLRNFIVACTVSTRAARLPDYWAVLHALQG